MLEIEGNQSKGLSQILYLIIAASVLMMVALSMIFMFNDTVGGSTGDVQACTTAISTQCSASGASSISIPNNCITENAEGEAEVISAVQDYSGNGYDATVSCDSQGGGDIDTGGDSGDSDTGEGPSESPFSGGPGS